MGEKQSVPGTERAIESRLLSEGAVGGGGFSIFEGKKGSLLCPLKGETGGRAGEDLLRLEFADHDCYSDHPKWEEG